jgi:nucleoside-diphosphate-sugar epimerase
MKRAFVTGASGFIGAAVVRQLLKDDWEVAVLQRGESVGHRLHSCADDLHLIKSIGHSISGFESEFREWKPDTVFHLGWGGVGSMHRNDASIQLANIEFACELANLCGTCKINHFIGAGSQAEYGPKNHLILETECPAPTTLYGAAKLSAFALTERICELAGVQHSWLRIFSTYGPDDNPDWMLPSLARQLLQGKRPSLTPCEQTWDYLYVDDAATAFTQVASKGVTGVFNLASGIELPLRNVIETVRDLINPETIIGFGDVPYRSDQVMRMQVGIDRLCNKAKWQPSWRLEQGLAAMISKIKSELSQSHESKCS